LTTDKLLVDLQH